MNKTRVVLVCFLLVFFLFVNISAQEIPNYQDKYVNDFGNVLNVSQVSELRDLFSYIDQETTAEVVFVSFDTINGEDLSQYATKIGETWKVGKADKDNGLVILYVEDINKIWVATGYGLEGILPDSKVGRLLDENYVPLRDSGSVAEGIVSFSYAVTQVIYDNKEEVLSGQASQQGLDFFDVIIIIVFLFVIWRIVSSVISLVTGGKKTSLWFIPLFLPSGGGSGSGFGGGGFGGGGFGGGGAGR